MGTSRMALLLTASGSFHAKLVAARLGSEGILVELRGSVDGPYPGMGPTYVYVREDELEAARELLQADELEAALDEPPEPRDRPAPWFAVAALVLVLATVLARFL